MKDRAKRVKFTKIKRNFQYIQRGKIPYKSIQKMRRFKTARLGIHTKNY